MVSNSYLSNYPDYSQPKIVSLITSGFTSMLKSWWEKYLTEDQRESIIHAHQTDDNGLPIFDENIGCCQPDGINALIYTIVRHFIGTPTNLYSRIHDSVTLPVHL